MYFLLYLFSMYIIRLMCMTIFVHGGNLYLYSFLIFIIMKFISYFQLTRIDTRICLSFVK